MCEHHDGIHLCGQTEELTEWQDVNAMTLRTDDGEVPMPPDHKVPTDCCNRLERADRTRHRWHFAFGGYIMTREIRCREGMGCNAYAPYWQTAHLREGWYELDE